MTPRPRAPRRWNLDSPAGPAWLRVPAERSKGWITPILLLALALGIVLATPLSQPRDPDAVQRRATRERRSELRSARTELEVLARRPAREELDQRRDDVRTLVATRRLHASPRLRDLAVAEVELRAAALELDALTRVSTSGSDAAAWAHVREHLEAIDLQENATHVP